MKIFKVRKLIVGFWLGIAVLLLAPLLAAAKFTWPGIPWLLPVMVLAIGICMFLVVTGTMLDQWEHDAWIKALPRSRLEELGLPLPPLHQPGSAPLLTPGDRPARRR